MYRLYYHQLRRQSQQDVYPNFGFVLDGIYKHSPNGAEGLGNLAAVQTNLFIPGLFWSSESECGRPGSPPSCSC